jgi:hypothetical protein
LPAVIFATGYIAGAGAGRLAGGWLVCTVISAGVAATTTTALAALVALAPLRSLLADARRPAPARDLAGVSQG